MIKNKKIGLIFLLLSSCLLSTEFNTRTQVLMGTFVHITLPSQYNREISKSFKRIRTLEYALSSYEPKATLFQLNQNHSVPYDAYLAEALRLSKQYYEDTKGYFDISIGSISKKLYHFGEENVSVPSKEALERATLNIDAIEINASSIQIQKGITLDLGGMGKGYAVDKVADYLAEQNISQGVVALSGDIRCLDSCTFELQSPYSEQTFMMLKSKISQLSISTSGTYRRYVGTQKYHHLINPKTAKQGRAFVSVSLFTHANNSKIDAYATALSVMPKEKALDFLKEHKNIGFVLVTHEGKILYGNLEKLVSFQWLDYKEKSTMPSISKKSKRKSANESSLIHPEVKTPKMISR